MENFNLKFKADSITIMINTFVCLLPHVLDMGRIHALNMHCFTSSDFLAPFNATTLKC